MTTRTQTTHRYFHFCEGQISEENQRHRPEWSEKAWSWDMLNSLKPAGIALNEKLLIAFCPYCGEKLAPPLIKGPASHESGDSTQ